MGKGKKSIKRRPGEERVKEETEPAKENKHGETPTTSRGQLTLHDCLTVSKPRSHPLAPLVHDNAAPDTSEPAEVKDADELKAPKQGNSGRRIPNGSADDPSVAPQKDSGTKKQTKPGQRINGEKSTDRKLKGKESELNRKVTDYFPVRRSCRKSKAELKCEKQRHIDDLLRNGVEDGLKVKCIDGKGRGIFADRSFQKDQFVVEYHGDLLEISDAKARESQYAEDPSTGCYMYYFRFHDKTYCVDATKESTRLGRLINHSKNGNLRTKLHDLNGTPHLIFLASRDIEVDEELLYDYGDRSKDAIAAHPWLKH